MLISKTLVGKKEKTGQIFWYVDLEICWLLFQVILLLLGLCLFLWISLMIVWYV